MEYLGDWYTKFHCIFHVLVVLGVHGNICIVSVWVKQTRTEDTWKCPGVYSQIKTQGKYLPRYLTIQLRVLDPTSHPDLKSASTFPQDKYLFKGGKFSKSLLYNLRTELRPATHRPFHISHLHPQLQSKPFQNTNNDLDKNQG